MPKGPPALHAVNAIERARHLLSRTQPPGMHLAGTALALEAMWHWRVAPPLLAPDLAELLASDHPDVRAAAALTLSTSLISTRATADRLVPTLDDPVLGPTIAVALGRAGDHRADARLLRMMRTDDPEPGLPKALAVAAADSTDPAGMVAAARDALATSPDVDTGLTCMATRVLTVLGPAAADAVPDLTARLQRAVDLGPADGTSTSETCEALCPAFVMDAMARIGPAAGAAVPLLRRCTTGPHYDKAVRALVMVTADRTLADRYIATRSARGGAGEVDADLLRWLARHDGLTADQHRFAREELPKGGIDQATIAEALWHQEGPSVVPELLAHLYIHLYEEYLGGKVLQLLAVIGPPARSVLRVLDPLIDRPQRVAVYLSDASEVMRADEVWLARALSARERITA